MSLIKPKQSLAIFFFILFFGEGGGGRHLVVFCAIQASLVRKRRQGKFSGFKESEFLLSSKNIPAEKSFLIFPLTTLLNHWFLL